MMPARRSDFEGSASLVLTDEIGQVRRGGGGQRIPVPLGRGLPGQFRGFCEAAEAVDHLGQVGDAFDVGAGDQ